MAKELKQRKGESLKPFITRVVNKWEEVGKIEVNSKALGCSREEIVGYN